MRSSSRWRNHAELRMMYAAPASATSAQAAYIGTRTGCHRLGVRLRSLMVSERVKHNPVARL